MLLSLVLWSCANKPIDTEVPAVSLDARTGTMVPEAATAEPARPAVRMPEGEPISRECYADSRKKARSAPAASVPTASAPVAGGGAKGNRGDSGYGSTSGSGGVAAGPSPSPSPKLKVVEREAAAVPTEPTVAAASPPPAPPRAEPAPEPAKWSPVADGADRANDELTSARPTKPLAAAESTPFGKAEEQKADKDDTLPDADLERSMATGTEKRPLGNKVAQEAARFDWGGTTYLSNDDSMSLASAQRLLWAVQQRGPVKASEVRPHELLNYFSFDTSPVPSGDTFGVNAVAEQTDEHTLSLALAIKGMTPERKPLDLTLVLDRSGSMSAEGRMEYLKRGLRQMSGQLERGDRVDVVLFDGDDCTPLENFVVGRDDPALLSDVINNLQPRGSTDLNDGLREGYRVAKTHADVEGRNRRMVLISDALLNTGEVNPDIVSEIGRSYEESGIRLSAVGVGRDFNDKVLDQLSEKGKGAYVYLGSEAVVDRVFGAGFRSLTQTVAHDVHFSLHLPPSLAMEKFYGEESSTVKSDVQPIHYYADTTQLFVQDLRMNGSRPVRSDVVRLTAEWTDVDTGVAREQSFSATVGDLVDGDARNLHKGRALLAWTDMILARSLGNDPCGAPFTAWTERVDTLGEDAEVAWLDSLTAPLCGARPTVPKSVATVSRVPYKVRVDADQVIAEVELRCGAESRSEALRVGSNVAVFDVRPGSCEVVLQGNVPMVASVQVPSVGGDVRCLVRGGRIRCG